MSGSASIRSLGAAVAATLLLAGGLAAAQDSGQKQNQQQNQQSSANSADTSAAPAPQPSDQLEEIVVFGRGIKLLGTADAASEEIGRAHV